MAKVKRGRGRPRKIQSNESLQFKRLKKQKEREARLKRRHQEALRTHPSQTASKDGDNNSLTAAVEVKIKRVRGRPSKNQSNESLQTNEGKKKRTRKTTPNKRIQKTFIVQFNQTTSEDEDNNCRTVSIEGENMKNMCLEKKSLIIENDFRTLLNNILPDAIDTDSRVCDDMNSIVATEDNEKLYCSACLIPCKIEHFFSHITKTHASPNIHDSFSTFSIPVLLPKYRLAFPEKSDLDRLDDWNLYCDKCNISHDSNADFESHLKNYHGNVSDPADKGSPNLYCLSCNKHLTTKDSVIEHLDCADFISRNKETTFQPNSSQPKGSLGCSSGNNSRNEPLASTNSAVQDKTENLDFLLFNDPNYFCHICDRKYRNSNAYNVHVLRVHNKRAETNKGKRIIHPNIVPDVNDPNLYCAACEEYFHTPNSFAGHITYIHNLDAKKNKLPKIKQVSKKKGRGPCLRKIRNPSVLPSQYDPMFYCGGCDRRYKTITLFDTHLKKIHRFEVHKNDRSNTDNSILWRCLLCTKTFLDHESYNAHVRLIHNYSLATHKNIDDFTCYKCKKTYLTTRDVHNHLIHVHGLLPKFKTEPEETLKLIERIRSLPPSKLPLVSSSLPEQPVETRMYPKRGERSAPKNQKYQCPICKEIFFNGYEFGNHKEDNHNIFFIYDDLGFFCNLCDTFLKSELSYRSHLMTTHLIDELPEIESDLDTDPTSDFKYQQRQKNKGKKESSTKILNETELNLDEEYNYLSGKTYCEPCNLSYSTSAHYRLHCFKHHKSSYTF